MMYEANFKLLEGLSEIEDLVIHSNKKSIIDGEILTTLMGLYNDYYIWTKPNNLFDIKYCPKCCDTFDEDDYITYENISLKKLLELVAYTN